MESDKNPFPKLDLLPGASTIRRIGHFLFGQLQHEGLSDHNTGAAPMLDSHLYDQVQVHGFLYTGEVNEQLELPYGRDE